MMARGTQSAYSLLQDVLRRSNMLESTG